MATILTKKKDTTGAPVAGDLTNSSGGAELAVNTADKRLYTKDSGGNVVEVGTNPGTAVTFTAGTVSAPAITTTGDTNTGIFFPAADTIAFAEGGAEAMRITSAGDVGIGTTSPSSKLHVVGDVFVGNNSNLQWSAYSAGTSGVIWTGHGTNNTLDAYTTGTLRMRIDSSGNVGIGVTPSAWSAGKAVEVGQLGSALWNDTGNNRTMLLQNIAYTSSDYKYVRSSTAGRIVLSDGALSYSAGASGTAGNSVALTQVLAVERTKSLALEGATSQSGTGITFPATQSASSNANTLDDYEEGTWTPLWTRSSSNPTYSNETANGRYTKIGNLVTVSWYFLTSTISAGGSGAWYISNLPFPSASGTPQNHASIGRVYNNAEVTGLRAFNPNNTSRIEYMTVATDSNYSATANGYTILKGTLSYFV